MRSLKNNVLNPCINAPCGVNEGVQLLKKGAEILNTGAKSSNEGATPLNEY